MEHDREGELNAVSKHDVNHLHYITSLLAPSPDFSQPLLSQGLTLGDASLGNHPNLHCSLNAKATTEVLPTSTVTTLSCFPKMAVHASKVYWPGGRFLIAKVPACPVTA